MPESRENTMREREIVDAIKAACDEGGEFLEICSAVAERFGVEQGYVEKLYDEIDCGDWDEDDEEDEE